jgi:aspartate/methionine/tyrosine aminotransferase
VELSSRAIASGSFSKTYSLAGLRLGWIVGPREVIDACRIRRDYTTISCNLIGDWLATLALRHRDKVMARNLTLLRRNFRIVDDWVAEEPLVSYVPPRAGSTAFLQYDLDVPSRQLCERLVKEKSTFLVPGQCFEMEGYLRLGYACDTEVLKTGLARLKTHLHSYI